MALAGMSGCPAVSSFCAIVTPPTSLIIQSASTVPIVSGDNHGDDFAVPVSRQGMEKDRDDVGPSPRLGYRLQTELAAKNVQIALCRDDENVVGPDIQAFGDEFDWHLRIAGENLMEPGSNGPTMVDDDDRSTEIGGQMPKQACVGIEPPAEPPTQTTGKSLIIIFGIHAGCGGVGPAARPWRSHQGDKGRIYLRRYQ
jgi:hypothetical protein